MSAKPSTKPSSEKIVHGDLKIFSVREPFDQVEVIRDGKKVKEWLFRTYHFTTADEPVTYRGVQYVPLNCFDQVRWDQITSPAQPS